jgi:cysteine-S-conjugate beta-lyase
MDFDRVVDRRGTLSVKWDNPGNGPGKSDIIPLWVADMDFPPPPAVVRAIARRAEHPIYGYARTPDEYLEAVARWYASRHGAKVDPGELLTAPSVMPAIGAAMRAFSEPGEAVIVMPPVYYPFFSIVRDNGRHIAEAPLTRAADGSWSLEGAALDAAADAAEAAGHRPAALLVSSPHNPVGRVWSELEAGAMLEFCERRGLTLLCDEIHADIIPGGRPFRSLAASEGPIVVFGGPNKTFNIAGLHISHVVAPREAERRAMKSALAALGSDSLNVFSLVAARAAYSEGADWLDALLDYLRGNDAFLRSFMAERLPGASAPVLEGTYLAWLDARPILERLGMADERALAKRLEEEGRVKVSAGGIFGRGGAGHFRINLACPRSVLAEGLGRMARTVEAALAERG